MNEQINNSMLRLELALATKRALESRCSSGEVEGTVGNGKKSGGSQGGKGQGGEIRGRDCADAADAVQDSETHSRDGAGNPKGFPRGAADFGGSAQGRSAVSG